MLEVTSVQHHILAHISTPNTLRYGLSTFHFTPD